VRTLEIFISKFRFEILLDIRNKNFQVREALKIQLLSRTLSLLSTGMLSLAFTMIHNDKITVNKYEYFYKSPTKCRPNCKSQIQFS